MAHTGVTRDFKFLRQLDSLIELVSSEIFFQSVLFKLKEGDPLISKSIKSLDDLDRKRHTNYTPAK